MEHQLLTVEGGFRCKTSSTLKTSSSSCVAKNMFDDSLETCWNSDQGTPQYILLDFAEKVEVTRFSIQFQGGFAGSSCELYTGSNVNDLTAVSEQWNSIRDSTEEQSYTLPTPITSTRYLKLQFPSSTDFYGRIIVYSLKVYGSRK